MASEWQEYSLGDLVEIVHGFAFQGEHFSEEPTNEILLTPGNFAVGGGFKRDKFKYYTGPVPLEFVLAEGDLVVTMTDLSKAADTLGFPARIPTSPINGRFLHNQRLGKVIKKPGVRLDLQFLYYVLCGQEYRNEVIASLTGTTVKHTSPSRIKNYRFRLPPEGEQRAIAHILGTLDDKIELNRRMNETLEAMARALFKSWFVDFDPVRTKAARRDLTLPKHLADLFPDSFEDSVLGKIPKGWRVGSFLESAKLLSGGTPKTERKDYWGGDILWASAKDISQSSETFIVTTERTITQKGLAESATQLIPAFCTVVVARGATTGRMALLGQETAMNQTCYALESSTGTPFALYCRLRHEIERLVHGAHGSVFDTITTSTFAGSTILLPPKPILEYMDMLISPLLMRVLANVRESHVLSQIRDTLLPELISGEIQVKDTERLAM